MHRGAIGIFLVVFADLIIRFLLDMGDSWAVSLSPLTAKSLQNVGIPLQPQEHHVYTVILCVDM